MPILHLSRTTKVGLASSRVMYHGTSTGRTLRILKGILSTGLVDPKKMCSKRERCVGVHVTEDISQALEYLGHAQGDFGGNGLLIVVRADVAASPALPDSDLSGMAIKFRKQLGSVALNTWSLVEKLVPKYSQLARLGREDVISVSNIMQVNAKQGAAQFIADFLAQLDITSYSKEFYRDTYTYIRNVLLANCLYGFASTVQELLSNELEKHRAVMDEEELAMILGYVCKVLAEENTDISSSFKLPSKAGLSSTLSNFYKSLNDLLNAEYAIPAYVFKLFLISPKFVTTSDDKVFTFAYNDTIGYSGRTRIIGVIEFPRAKDLDLDQVKQSGMCRKQYRDDDDDIRYKRQNTMLVPVARVYHGTGSGFVKAAIVESAKLLYGRSDDIPICTVADAYKGSPQLSATFSKGYLYGNISVSSVCDWI